MDKIDFKIIKLNHTITNMSALQSQPRMLCEIIKETEELLDIYKRKQDEIKQLEHILKEMEANKDSDIYDFLDAQEYIITITENADKIIKELNEKIKQKDKVVKDTSIKR